MVPGAAGGGKKPGKKVQARREEGERRRTLPKGV